MTKQSQGTIRQMEPNKPRGKCRTWQLRVRTGLNPRTGKYGEKTRIFHGPYRQAQSALIDFIDELDNQQSTTPGRKLTFEQLSAEYVPHRLDMRQIAPKTASKIKGHLDALSLHVGKMPADKLEPYMIQDAVKAMLSGDSAKGIPLSGTYVNMVLQSASTMYKNYAIPQGIASSNPFEKVERPKLDTKQRKPLTREQEQKLLEICTPTDRRFAAVVMADLGGLRRGECVSVKWKDVDLINSIMMLPDTKGSDHLTAIPIQDRLVSFLLEWKEEQARQMKQWRVIQNDEMTVCANDLGDPLDGNTLGRWWRRNRKKFGCEDVHFHDLRHTFSTNLAKARTHPKAIQELLRQRDDRVATRIYTHVDVSSMRDALNCLNLPELMPE